MELHAVQMDWVGEYGEFTVWVRVDDNYHAMTKGYRHVENDDIEALGSNGVKILVDAAKAEALANGKLVINKELIRDSFFDEKKEADLELIFEDMAAINKEFESELRVAALAGDANHELLQAIRSFKDNGTAMHLASLLRYLYTVARSLWMTHRVDLFNIGEDDGINDFGKTVARLCYKDAMCFITSNTNVEGVYITNQLIDPEVYEVYLKHYSHIDQKLFIELSPDSIGPQDHDKVNKLITEIEETLGHVPLFNGNIKNWIMDVIGDEKFNKLLHKEIFKHDIPYTDFISTLLKCDVRYMSDGFNLTFGECLKAGVKHVDFSLPTLARPELMPLSLKIAFINHHKEYHINQFNWRLVKNWIMRILSCKNEVEKVLPGLNADYYHGESGSVSNDVYEEIKFYALDYVTLRWCLRHAKHLTKVRNVRAPDGRTVRFHNTDIIKYLTHEKLKGNPYMGWKAVLAIVQEDVEKQIQKILNSNKVLPSHPLIEKSLEHHPEIRLMRCMEDLRVEGLEMAHCVAGYSDTCLHGGTWILHVGGEKLEGATAELCSVGNDLNGTECFIIKQMRSYDNDEPNQRCELIIRGFMDTLQSYSQDKKFEQLAA